MHMEVRQLTLVIAPDRTVRDSQQQHFAPLVLQFRSQIHLESSDIDIHLLRIALVPAGTHLLEFDPQWQIWIREIHIGKAIRERPAAVVCRVAHVTLCFRGEPWT